MPFQLSFDIKRVLLTPTGKSKLCYKFFTMKTPHLEDKYNSILHINCNYAMKLILFISGMSTQVFFNLIGVPNKDQKSKLGDIFCTQNPSQHQDH